uniref:Dynamin_M domain-containing protein n=1 Tax=Mesocestoides corti TaxID=53468 RepID=A0A5K3FLB6_MESCO
MKAHDSDKTLDVVVRGYPHTQRLHIHGDEPHSQLQPPHIPVGTTALQERLQKEELFLTSLLAQKRQDRKRSQEELAAQVDWILQCIPIDMLTFQWLDNCTISLGVRAFLVEHLLPSLVLGLEHILREADKRGLCTENGVKMDVNFNPINRLAEFLMRNNPKHGNLTRKVCLNPYTKGMRQVLNLLKQDLFLKSDTELARHTAASEERKLEWEKMKEMVARELDEKSRQLEPMFDCFRVNESETVNAAVVQKSIRSFLKTVLNVPEDLQLIERPMVHVEHVDVHVEDYVRSEFMAYVMECVRPLSMEVFGALFNHMQRCAREYQEHVNRRLRLGVSTEIGIGFDKDADPELNRAQVFEMFDQFANEANEQLRKTLVDPHEWRIHEYHLRHSKFDPWDQSVQILPYSPSKIFDQPLQIGTPNYAQDDLEVGFLSQTCRNTCPPEPKHDENGGVK